MPSDRFEALTHCRAWDSRCKPGITAKTAAAMLKAKLAVRLVAGSEERRLRWLQIPTSTITEADFMSQSAWRAESTSSTGGGGPHQGATPGAWQR